MGGDSRRSDRSADKVSEKSVKVSRMDRIRSSLPQRPKFNIQRPNFQNFHLPERPKFNIKRPNISLPAALQRKKKPEQEEQRQASTESTAGSRRNIFDFSTYPRIFDRKSRKKGEYSTSSPKESRAQSTESSTFPRTKKKGMVSRWHQRFSQTSAHVGDENTEPNVVERSQPWRHPSLEKPRLSIQLQDSVEDSEQLPWELRRQLNDHSEEGSKYSGSAEMLAEQIARVQDLTKFNEEMPDPRMYGDRIKYSEDTSEDGLKENVKLRWLNESASHDEINQFKPGGLRSRSLDERNINEKEIELEKRKLEGRMMDSEEEYEEDSSMRSDKEQQPSSGSSYDRTGQRVIDDIEFEDYENENAEQDEINMQRYLMNEIEMMTSPKNALVDEIAPERPARGFKKRKEDSQDSYENARRSMREGSQHSEDSTSDGYLNRQLKHRVVYQAESSPFERSVEEPLDDIVVVKPERRRSSASRISQLLMVESSIITNFSSINNNNADAPPPVPLRRKRMKKDSSPICNGHHHREEWQSGVIVNNHSTRDAVDEVKPLKFAQDANPVPPKRRSRSRTASVAPEEDRTSHGAESIPEIEYMEDDIPRDEDSLGERLPGYAVIDKREKPPRPPPPRRKKDKFATTPRTKRSLHGYSTVGRTTASLSDDGESTILRSVQSAIQLDYADDDKDHKLRSGEVLSKMQGRPLPAPPRPPRVRKKSLDHLSDDLSEEFQTRTEPLPGDAIAEVMEEVMAAKLTLTPSRTGSQVFVSTERIPSPTSMPSIPPRPTSPVKFDDDDKDEDYKEPRRSPSEERLHREDQIKQISDLTAQIQFLRSALFSGEALRIDSLEVGDLKVDRLNVSQMESHKITASEIDAIVVSATTITSSSGNNSDEDASLNPTLLRELMAIRSYLETVVEQQEQAMRAQEQQEQMLKAQQEQLNAQQEQQKKIEVKQMEIVDDASRREIQVEHQMAPSQSSATTTSTLMPARGDVILKTQIVKEAAAVVIAKDTAAEEDRRSSSRSRSSSPSRRMRQTASPVRQLPPVISVTPDSPQSPTGPFVASEVRPQRAVMSYTSHHRREPIATVTAGDERSDAQVALDSTKFIAFPTSQIPASFFALAAAPSTAVVPAREPEPSIVDTSQQLLRALRIAGNRAIRQFSNYVANRVGGEDSVQKFREVEMAICALILVIAGLLIVFFGSPRTITHYHHWDYFYPPQ